MAALAAFLDSESPLTFTTASRSAGCPSPAPYPPAPPAATASSFPGAPCYTAQACQLLVSLLVFPVISDSVLTKRQKTKHITKRRRIAQTNTPGRPLVVLAWARCVLMDGVSTLTAALQVKWGPHSLSHVSSTGRRIIGFTSRHCALPLEHLFEGLCQHTRCNAR